MSVPRYALAALLLTVGSCRPSPPPEIRIGVLATFTGPFAACEGTKIAI